jgi:hypothetical protein
MRSVKYLFCGACVDVVSAKYCKCGSYRQNIQFKRLMGIVCLRSLSSPSILASREELIGGVDWFLFCVAYVLLWLDSLLAGLAIRRERRRPWKITGILSVGFAQGQISE